MERLDDVLGYKDLKIYQNSDYFSFSLDSIILANYSTIRLRDQKIIDFCTGNAVIPLILSQRYLIINSMPFISFPFTYSKPHQPIHI